jgi:nucleoside-diphosphate-sugar epimerase
VHIHDISRAFLAMLEAPRETVHDVAFNVGGNDENYQIRDVAKIVGEVVEGSEVTLAEGAGPDKRSYRVSFDRIESELGFTPEWTVRRSVEEMLAAYRSIGLTIDEFNSPRFLRLMRVKQLVAEGRLTGDLRRREAPVAR